jgi:uncharacterized protein involved in outer membrane biogenesis
MKKILIGVALLIAVIAAALFFVMHNLDRYIARLIEQQGSEATAASVRVAGVELSLRSGQGTIRGLSIGSPAGFEADHAFQLGRIHLDLDVKSVSRDPVVIKRILIEKPQLTYEVSTRGTNLGTIQKNVDRYVARLGGGAKSSGSKPAGEATRKLVIQRLDILGGQVKVMVGSAEGEFANVALADIHLRDIGANQGGVTGPQVAARILGVLTRAAAQSAGRVDMDTLRKGAAGAAGKAAADAVKGLFGE